VGQKTHPLGFRLGITQKHKSIWFSNHNEYAVLLKEDDQIRTYLKPFVKTASISDININRNTRGDKIEINIEAARPGMLVGDKGKNIKTISNSIKKLLPKHRNVCINVKEIENADLNAALLADYVAEQLQKRIAFRRAIRKAMQRAEVAKASGIKIQVSGRLNGAEMARSEWIREGRLPLQTLRADIDYATKEANTIYGILGIKVWLFKNEILGKQ
jgi:small subunit ribosomal protein S3